MPPARSSLRTCGNTNPLAGAAGGGDSLAGCCASTGATPRMAMARMAMASGTWKMLRRMSALRHHGQHGAVFGSQVLLRRSLHQLGSDLGQLRLDGVDARRVVVEQREGGEQVGATK